MYLEFYLFLLNFWDLPAKFFRFFFNVPYILLKYITSSFHLQIYQFWSSLSLIWLVWIESCQYFSSFQIALFYLIDFKYCSYSLHFINFCPILQSTVFALGPRISKKTQTIRAIQTWTYRGKISNTEEKGKMVEKISNMNGKVSCMKEKFRKEIELWKKKSTPEML